MAIINWQDFELIELRIGKVIDVKDFEKTIKPAYKIWVDFGAGIGIKKTSAQLTALYSKEELIGKQIIGLVNIEQKQIANFISEFLLTGFYNADGNIVLAVPEKHVLLGSKLC